MLKKELIIINILLLRWYRETEKSFSRLLIRFRYPGTLPEELARDLGIKLPHRGLLKELVIALMSSLPKSRRLSLHMSRDRAEASFKFAVKKEKFHSTTLFSYYFSEGWLVFTLYFDQEGRLGRLQLQTPFNVSSHYDLPLPSEKISTNSAYIPV